MDCNSLIRLADPLTRNIPSTSVASHQYHDIIKVLPFSFRKTPHLATMMGILPYTSELPLAFVIEMLTYAY